MQRDKKICKGIRIGGYKMSDYLYDKTFCDKTAIILDFDRTIVNSGRQFQQMWYEFEMILLDFEFRGEKLDNVFQRFKQRASEMTNKFGYTPERIAFAFSAILEEEGFFLGEEVIPVYKGIAEAFWKMPDSFIDGAKEFLEQFDSDKNFYLILITVGSPCLQTKRIENIDIGKYFKEIHVLKYGKTTEIFNGIKRCYPLVFNIGDSFERDIIPTQGLDIYNILFNAGRTMIDLSKIKQFPLNLSIMNSYKQISEFIISL